MGKAAGDCGEPREKTRRKKFPGARRMLPGLRRKNNLKKKKHQRKPT